MSDKIDIDALLEKNPKAREVFEKNKRNLPKEGVAKKPGYGVGIPYGVRNLQPDDGQIDGESEHRTTYTRV